MSERPRADDHLVEPLYSALDSGRESAPDEPPKPGSGSRRVLYVLAVLALITTIWFVTIGA